MQYDFTMRAAADCERSGFELDQVLGALDHQHTQHDWPDRTLHYLIIVVDEADESKIELARGAEVITAQPVDDRAAVMFVRRLDSMAFNPPSIHYVAE